MSLKQILPFCWNNSKAAILRRLHRSAIDDVDHYLGHPVNAFLLVKRFIWEWVDVENWIKYEGPRTGQFNESSFLFLKHKDSFGKEFFWNKTCFTFDRKLSQLYPNELHTLNWSEINDLIISKVYSS